MASGSELSVTYFRSLVITETATLKGLCAEWTEVMKTNTDIPEDVLGDINVAIGQAELLMKERFAQFARLIDDCEFDRGEKTITCQDLQGFWDIVFFQVEDVQRKFSKLSKMKTNDWKEPEPEVPKIVMKKKKIPVKMAGTKPVVVRPKPGGGIRAHILAARQKMQTKAENKENKLPLINVEKPVTPKPEARTTLGSKENNAKSPETNVFDAGFFKVETPVKGLSVLTTCNSENKLTTRGTRMTTPGPKTSPDKSELKVLSSSVLRERISNSPKVHKDYSPCMRITRSMKIQGIETRRLEFS